MTHIRLANWLNGRAPGEVVEVPDGELPALRRDGRVAEVVEQPTPAVVVEPESAADEPEKPPRRTRRGDT